MDQVDVCNSWEEFDDNSKLLEQQLEKLKIQKGSLRSGDEKQSTALQSPTSSVSEEAPKMRILKRTDPVIKPEVTNKEALAASTNGDDSNGVVIQDESMRTQYVPPEPRISILSRPKKKTSDEATTSNSSQSKNKNQQLKTLEQREQEYAEARRRIFGDGDGDTTETT